MLMSSLPAPQGMHYQEMGFTVEELGFEPGTLICDKDFQCGVLALCDARHSVPKVFI